MSTTSRYTALTESDFYDLMGQDASWDHSQTFVGDVLWDTAVPCLWKVEEHDITGTHAQRVLKRSVVFVRAERDDNWK